MQLVGIIGGMSCESTALYYRWLNEGARARLGGLHSAELIIRSVDFAQIEAWQISGEWEKAGECLAEIAQTLEKAGAQYVLLATNTMHKVASSIESSITVPLVHIADCTGARIATAGLKRPGLMATAYTMSEDFFTGRLRRRFGFEILTPQGRDRDDTHAIIFEELCRGEINASSRARYVEIAETLVKRGADSVILGCTEVSMLLNDGNVAVPVFDTARIHAETALKLAFGETAMGRAA